MHLDCTNEASGVDLRVSVGNGLRAPPMGSSAQLTSRWSWRFTRRLMTFST